MDAAECAINKEALGDSPRCRTSVLLVESDFKSAVLISRIFRELGLLDDLVISVDCENALMRLNQAGSTRPMMVLLDLAMPRMSALSFLKLLKEDAKFQTIPVVVLADSNRPEDVSACYSLGAAGYLIKSHDYGELQNKLQSVCTYWTLSCLPGA